MRESAISMLLYPQTIFDYLKMNLDGQMSMAASYLQSFTAPEITQISNKSKNAITAAFVAQNKTYNAMLNIIKNNNDALTKFLTEKYDQLGNGIEYMYVDIDRVYVAQMNILQTQQQQQQSTYAMINCVTNFGDQQGMQLWNKKMDEVRDTLMYYNDLSSMSSNPNIIAIQKFYEEVMVSVSNCMGTPSDDCVAKVVCLFFSFLSFSGFTWFKYSQLSYFPAGKPNQLTVTKDWVSKETTNQRNAIKAAVTLSFKNGMLQLDALRKSIGGCSAYFPSKVAPQAG